MTDVKVLAWLVGSAVSAAAVVFLGFLILLAMVLSDPNRPQIGKTKQGPPLLLTPDSPSAAAGLVFEALTDREREVLALMAGGAPTRASAGAFT